MVLINQNHALPLNWFSETISNRKPNLHCFGANPLENRIRIFYLDILRLKAIVASGDNTKIYLLCMLCYLFDNNELTNAELMNIKEESALYSLHVVGWWVRNSLNKTVIIADPNGALIGESNMEFLIMPLMKLQSKSTTSLSCYDRM